ncbi:MAG: carboxypeptidase regulatory-like domain-containing protein [Gemmatimonadaceae bacterium]
MPRIATFFWPSRRALLALTASLAVITLAAARLGAQATPGASGHDTTGATVSGTVFDSLSGHPLAGALVQFVGQGASGQVLSAQTDRTGAFHLAAVPAGQYLVGFMHPVLDSLGLSLQPRTIQVTSGPDQQVALGVPGGAAVRARLCPPVPPGDSTGALIGFVRDADSGAPIADGTVIATWVELIMDTHVVRTVRRRVPVQTDSSGWYALCGIPSASAIAAKAESGRNSSGYANVTVPARGILHVDFGVPTGSAAVVGTGVSAGPLGGAPRSGTARVAGVVRDAEGRPIAGAQLHVWGSAASANSDTAGAFTLTGLPAGTQTLEARHVGFVATRMTVDLASGRAAPVSVSMAERADVLDAVTVYGKKSARVRDNTGFLDRQKAGLGYFLTRADIEKRNALTFTDLLRMAPGFLVYPTGGLGYEIVSNRDQSCQPQIFIDGVLIRESDAASIIDDLVSPGEISGVEVYAGSLETPPEFRGASSTCGSIVIWTKQSLAAAQQQGASAP